MRKNKDLNKANKAKNDLFYTQLTDIEKELKYYKHHFKNKVVFCNCDDPEYSNFWKYFELNFNHLGLKKLIATHYHDSKPTYKLELSRDINEDGIIDKFDVLKTPLMQNGDFRSPECIEILKEADIICTNPPFSLFRSYVSQLIEYDKKFLIIGNINCLTYKEVFPHIKNNKLWLGNGMGRWISGFIVPDHYELYGTEAKVNKNGKRIVSTNNCLWLTNLDIAKRHQDIILYKIYDEKEYPKYDNYNAINVNKVKDIPIDYYGVMGVPITFMDKHNPEQFEIIGADSDVKDGKLDYLINRKWDGKLDRGYLNGKRMYSRIFIKRKEN